MSTTRAGLRDRLQLSATNPTKTFVLDVHTDDPEAYLIDLVGLGSIERTDDASLHGVHVEEGDFWVDQIDSRFWSFHTDMPSEAAHRFLRLRIEGRRDLDWMWLPSEHLRQATHGMPARRVKTEFSGQGLLGPGAATSRLKLQATGAGAERLLDYLAKNSDYRSAVSLEGIQVDVGDQDFGPLTEALTRLGRFAASGDSLELHMQFVRGVIERYAAFVRALEAKAIGWDALDNPDGGGTLHGQPVVIAFSREIPDLHRFADELLASRVPFRLWGLPQIVADNGARPVMQADAVDLHVGQRLRMEIGQTWMRVHLERGACGNTVARLVSNLQHRFDSALSLVDPELQDGLTAQTSGLGAAAN
jgi:hypothetical protein